MQYKCKSIVIDKKVFLDLQEKYLADPNSGACPLQSGLWSKSSQTTTPGGIGSVKGKIGTVGQTD